MNGAASINEPREECKKDEEEDRGGLLCISRGAQPKLLERQCTDPSFERGDRTWFGDNQ